VLELIEPQEPNIRDIREQLRGFLGKSTQSFCKKLWELLLSAQQDVQGIPPQLIELKRREIEEQRVSY
jgi:serine/arginine repetitive matrix protein 1